ncbi:putative CDP-glycerol:glycerophosphate glycerophosphotransferase [Bacillus mycoides]|uniref:CDP-glycerol glycerophosphotransferase family protein n=1 Tax=Bacillus mycoides TaxID=1405 RepID=UPI0008640C20|nr:CDP-glycerol glycerophosphotransferase family protein [Bacillus mycoides]OFD53583.1 putative CDP-glycerol:glycerophosphate glycerophosphotransferase [Bacillus mycoides]OFD58864.1 putative CDP-glycerol:glycerophosphate glycerophosphotransferase [Bacillus mycoides]OFD90076.1 putative CDP-glycerol:glycerophosphate glycerophosphotransferase [Bacillus mycoides]OHX28855.1 putative CDP-glycerol:glycerophosphate glycerophosphotransferase [Bacillus mycoides]SCM90165.1 Teichoic acid biosynthesis prot
MIREIIVEVYLILFAILHNIMKIFPVKRKVTFIMSYGENLIFIYDEMKRQKIDYNVVFLYKPTCKYEVDSYSDVKSYKFETKNLFHTIKAVYHLSTSQYVIVDNYFGSLANVKFKKGVECIQIWHAAGAFKKFGLLAPSFKKRSLRAQNRFMNVYQHFHKIVVGSEELADIYKEAFALSDNNILKTGIPRTDLFFNEQKQQKVKDSIFIVNPNLKSKKVILYAPTFRDKELVDFDLHLDIDEMYRQLKDEYVLIVKLHPAIRNRCNYEERYEGFLYDYSLYPNVNDLFLVTDILVTDYSSIPFEFCLLNKPIIFFAYDLKKYMKKRGVIGDYVSDAPGPVVYTTEEVVQVIKSGSFKLDTMNEFTLKWNEYSKGTSSLKFVENIFMK